jgi:hypothetical protein
MANLPNQNNQNLLQTLAGIGQQTGTQVSMPTTQYYGSYQNPYGNGMSSNTAPNYGQMPPPPQYAQQSPSYPQMPYYPNNPYPGYPAPI